MLDHASAHLPFIFARSFCHVIPSYNPPSFMVIGRDGGVRVAIPSATDASAVRLCPIFFPRLHSDADRNSPRFAVSSPP